MLYDYILKAKVRSIFIIYQEKKDNKLDSYSEFNFFRFSPIQTFVLRTKKNTFSESDQYHISQARIFLIVLRDKNKLE